MTSSGCPFGTYFADSCVSCPLLEDESLVSFSDSSRDFEGIAGVNETQLGRTVLINLHNFSVLVVPVDIPSWIEFVYSVSALRELQLEIGGPPVPITAEGLLPFEFQVNFSTLEVGTTVSNISFAVWGKSSYTGCPGPNATLQVRVEASPPELNYIGPLIGVGWFMLAVITFSCLFCMGWVYWNRRVRVVKVMQPLFLIVICVGVLLVGLSILWISLTDENVSERAADVSCVAAPWFLVMGFTIIFSALFSKLWRINKIFHGSQQCRKLRVTERDVLGPFLILFTLSFTLLLLRTILNPQYFERIVIDGDPGNTIASCGGHGVVTEDVFSLLAILVIGTAFVLTCIQAYRARNISDEFSESKNLRITLFVWIQILVIGLPVLFLIGFDSPTTSYFVVISMIFCLCMSMLLTLFVPIFVHYRRLKREGGLHSSSNPQVRVTGMSTTRTSDATHSNAAAANILMDTDEDDIGLSNELTVLRQTVHGLKAKIKELETENKELASRIAIENGTKDGSPEDDV